MNNVRLMQIVSHYLIYFFTVVGNVVVYLRGNVQESTRWKNAYLSTPIKHLDDGWSQLKIVVFEGNWVQMNYRKTLNCTLRSPFSLFGAQNYWKNLIHRLNTWWSWSRALLTHASRTLIFKLNFYLYSTYALNEQATRLMHSEATALGATLFYPITSHHPRTRHQRYPRRVVYVYEQKQNMYFH